MNENLNEINVNDMQDNSAENLSEKISNDSLSGVHSSLFKRINSITINDLRIKEAFTTFIKEVECGKTFSVSEILSSAEGLLKKGTPDENAGNYIYCFDYNVNTPKRPAAKLLKNSVAGVYALFSIHNGLALDLPAIGGSLDAAESKRFLVISPKKADKLVNEAKSHGMNPVRAGVVLANNRILLTNGNETVASIDKSQIDASSDAVSVTLGHEHFAAFLSGYNAACSIALCNCVSSNNIIRFGLADGLNCACARALGYFYAAMYLKLYPVRIVYTTDNGASVAVSRPNVSDGDYLYLLKLRVDQNSMPDKAHYGQLLYYLSEKKRMGIIKDVLPMRENIQKLVNRLQTDVLEYVPLAPIPTDCFGVVVSVGRGESVNGIKLGYFKNI